MILSPPAIEPLSRLQVSQGLLITTERWKHAQTYHRQRQNLHYQSLHQPGIVRGFGVCSIAPPSWAKGPELNHLWVRILPGIAIDVQGNPIILENPRELAIDPFKLDVTQAEQHIVYLVAQYVDPEGDVDIAFLETADADDLETLPNDKLTEPCRFVQRSYGKLQPEDIELCRVQLQTGDLRLKTASSVHFPEDNTLDFRYRLTAKPRPQCTVQIGHIYTDDTARSIAQTTFSTLLRSTVHLSSLVQGQPNFYEISHDQLNAPLSNRHGTDPIIHTLENCHLLALQQPDLLSCLATGRVRFRQYLKQGGVILIEADANTEPLENIQKELVTVLETMDRDEELQRWGDDGREDWGELRSHVETRLEKVRAQLEQNIQAVCEDVHDFAQTINHAMVGDGHIEQNHPLRLSPFPFSSWPSINHQPMQVFCWDGIVLVFGKLSELWKIEQNAGSPQEIRAAQEWGLNLLHYAWKHHQLTQLQRGEGIHE